jgi:anti-anti-sigma regulatory factor
MQLATIRINDTEILSLKCPRLDARTGAALVELVRSSVEDRGARQVILDLGHGTVVDAAGARALEAASAKLGRAGDLVVVGLNGRARALLRSTGVAEHVRLVEWWADAVERTSRAA